MISSDRMNLNRLVFLRIRMIRGVMMGHLAMNEPRLSHRLKTLMISRLSPLLKSLMISLQKLPPNHLIPPMIMQKMVADGSGLISMMKQTEAIQIRMTLRVHRMERGKEG